MLPRSFALLAAFLPSWAHGAALDVSTDYRLRALSYKNLDLRGPSNDRSFITQNARLGVAVKNIQLETGETDAPSMDVVLALRGIGVAGSTGPLQSPFDRIAERYPNTAFIPYVESAFIKTHGLFGRPIDLTIGQQPFTLGSGLLLADDGVGLPGLAVRGTLPWWEMKAEGFVFQPRNNQSSGNSLMLFGFSLELPSEGNWGLHQLIEKDRSDQVLLGHRVSKATRSFTSVRYQISYGPMFFDGEAAIERGNATPTGPNPLDHPITFNGNAQVMRAKWKQPFWKGGAEGIARLTAARGSGDNITSPTTSGAFFPTRGHRFDGLERAGFGEFFGATPFDAFGGFSSMTANGLPPGVSGIISLGLGITPPAYRGIILDIDYWLFQADRNSSGPARTLGNEFDFRLRYGFRDRFNVSASAAFFKAGPAISTGKGSARRFMLEASARF